MYVYTYKFKICASSRLSTDSMTIYQINAISLFQLPLFMYHLCSLVLNLSLDSLLFLTFDNNYQFQTIFSFLYFVITYANITIPIYFCPMIMINIHVFYKIK